MITDAQYIEWLRKENTQRALLIEAKYFDSATPEGVNPELTFDRNSTAYKIDGSIVVAGAPRYENGKFNECVFLEETTVNKIITPNNWNLVGGATKVTDQLAPNGLLEATHVTNTANVSSYVDTPSGVFANSGTFTRSVYAKLISGTGTLTLIYNTGAGSDYATFDLSTGVVTHAPAIGTPSSSMVHVGDGWYRCMVTWTNAASGATPASATYISGYGATPIVSTIALWRPQTEQKNFASTYHPTTRNLETMLLPSANINTAEGSMEMWVKAPTITATSFRYLVHRDLLGLNDSLTFGVYTVNSVSNWFIWSGYGAGFNSSYLVALTSSEWTHIAVTWKDKTRMYINGVLKWTSANAPALQFPTNIPIGLNLNAYIDNFRVSNVMRTPAEIYQAAQGGAAMKWDSDTIALFDFDVAQERTKYLSTVPYSSNPTDSPANQPYDDCVVGRPAVSCALSDTLEGFTMPSWGDVLLDNSLFDKDSWLDYGWSGRTIKFLFGDPSWPLSDFRSIMTGTISGAPTAPSSNQIKIAVKDKQWELNKPVQNRLVGEPTLLAGNTYKIGESPEDIVSVDAVWDGDVLLNPATDYSVNLLTTPPVVALESPAVGFVSIEFTSKVAATGQVICLGYGECFNVTPNVLSVPLLKYQVHGGPIKAIVEVRDSGVPIAHVDDLENGTFELLSKPTGTVTCDFLGATSDGVFIEGVARIFRYIVLNQTDLTIDDIDHDSLSRFLALCPQRVGIFINARKNTLDVLDELMKSLGGFYTPDRNGKLIFGRIDPPETQTPAFDLTADDIVFGTLKIVKQSVPVQTVRVAYLHNYTPQAQTHGAVSDEDKAIYAQEWRYAKRSNPNVKIVHLLAAEPDARKTNLIDRVEAYAEADRQLALNGVVRTTYSAEFFTLPLSLTMGTLVRLTHPRYKLYRGKNLYIVGIKESAANRRVTLTLWG